MKIDLVGSYGRYLIDWWMISEHAEVELLASRRWSRPVVPPVESQYAHAHSSDGQWNSPQTTFQAEQTTPPGIDFLFLLQLNAMAVRLRRSRLEIVYQTSAELGQRTSSSWKTSLLDWDFWQSFYSFRVAFIVDLLQGFNRVIFDWRHSGS